MKRLIAIMLCVISLLSVLPTAAFAAVKEVDPETANTAEDANAAERESEPQRGPVEFWDVRPGDWFYNAVMWAKTSGITSGVRPGEFGPYETVNRAQVVTFLYAYKGKPDVSNMTNPFCDVDDNAYYHDAAVWAYNNEYALGSVDWCGNRSFMPGKVCTFPEIVTMLYAMAGKPSLEDGWSNPYSNVNGAYYRNAAVWSYYREIARFIGTGKKRPEIVPVDDEKLFPTYECDRATTVSLLYAFAVEEMMRTAAYYAEEHLGNGLMCDQFVGECASAAGLAGESTQYPLTEDGKPELAIPRFLSRGGMYMPYAILREDDWAEWRSRVREHHDGYFDLYFNLDNAIPIAKGSSFQPRYGDIIFFQYGGYLNFGEKNWFDHIGFVTSSEPCDEGRVTVYTIEGNCGSMVKCKDYTVDLTTGKTNKKSLDGDVVYVFGFGRIG